MSDAPPASSTSAVRRHLDRYGSTWCAVVGVLVPLVVLTVWTARAVPSFDGAMNLQVATDLADGRGFTRDYGGITTFPQEVETSGLYTFVAALVIKLFGVSFFSLALPNLLFFAALIVTVSAIFRPWPIAQLLAPSLVTLTAAGAVEFGGGGYGEVPTAALLLPALMLQASVIAGAGRPALRVGGSFLLLGVAATVKFVAIAAIPTLLLGLVLVLVLRRRETGWWIALTPLLAAVPLVLYELYRLAALGGSAYAEYWRGRMRSVGVQSGVSSTGETSGGILSTIADHGHLLATQTGLTGVTAALLVVVPGLLALIVFLLRRTGWREWLAAPRRALVVLLLTYAYSYWVWWLAVTPTEKAWLRRVVIGILMAAVAYGLLVTFLIERLVELRATRAESTEPARSRVPAAVPAVAGVVALAAVVGMTAAQIPIVQANVHQLFLGSGVSQQQVTQAADRVREFAAEGRPVLGGGWWSAPVISLVSGVPFGDLTELDPCDPKDVAELSGDRAVFVWDRYGMGIIGPTPTQNGFVFTKIDQPSAYVSFWTLTFAPGACATG